ncbi:hypothetical protein Raf01_33560 [Rugosimonospora africana]|uniref:Zinc-finger domain-containing protein n=1 Tax=Rugosimonospora africana TaxID=556532 RepID=A0A8J3QRC2_9ACTN|nr:hypothetical protein Raf01_33560 [Rugosimonospora africana]
MRYQAHLSGCQRCRVEVARLVGTRALLARLGEQAWAAAATQATRQPLPGGRRPHTARTSHRHAAMVSAAVVLAAGCLAVAPVLAARPEREHAIVAVMRPVAKPAPLYALLTLEPMANGSRISLLCGWSDVVAHTRWRLLLTVATRDHRSLSVAEWTATGDAVQPVSTWTDLDPSRITRVDLSTAANARLLTFEP